MPLHAMSMHFPSHPCSKQHEIITAAPLGGRTEDSDGTGMSG